jgi:hypothetical protein
MSLDSLKRRADAVRLRTKIILFTCAVVAVVAPATTRGPALRTAEASSPATSSLTVPSAVGQTVSVTWTGTIPPSAAPTNSCVNLADTPAVDQHLATVSVPAGVYNTVTAKFAFKIAWTPVVSGTTSDEVLSVVGPGGVVIGSSDGGNPSETVSAKNLDAGTYKVIACGFANAQPQPYTGTLTISTVAPPPVSPFWKINYHGTCCEGNLAASGPATYMLLPVLVNGNKIKRSLDGGKTWVRKYPPADASVPFGIEGDMSAWGDDVVFFGTELAQGVAAHSDDRGETWKVTQIPVAFAANDQAWSYLGPLSNMRPGAPLPVDEPYVLAGWYRIGSVVLFSFDGGLTWPIQTPLAATGGEDGPEHVVCQQVAHGPAATPGDTRVPNANFARMKSGRHGAWGTDRKFYWTETAGGQLYVCKTDNFGVTWAGVKHSIAAGPGSSYVATHAAFDSKGTLYVLHGNKLHVSFDQGESFRYVHTLPRFGNALRSDSGADQFFVIDNGTIHVGLLEAGPNGTANVYYLRGSKVDTSRPAWDEELVDVVDTVRLDFMQIVMDGNGIPTISYTTPTKEVTTASREAPPPCPSLNHALAAYGAIATASSTAGSNFPASGATDGDHTGANWEAGGGWNDATRDQWPDTLEVAFAGPRVLNEIRVYTLQNNYTSPAEPTPSTPADIYGIRDFDVQYWTGAAWATVPGGSVTGNDKAMRIFTFPDVTTAKIRVVVNNGRVHYSRITEVEAFGCAGP